MPRATIPDPATIRRDAQQRLAVVQTELLEHVAARPALRYRVQAGEASARAALERLETEVAALTREISILEDTIAEADRREAEAREADRQAAIRALVAQLADFDTRAESAFERLHRAARLDVRVLHEAAVAYRLAYSLAHDLHAVTGERQYQRPWAWRAKLLAFADHPAAHPHSLPHVDKPWRDLLARAQAAAASAA
ncbi:MAG: hypothetical protein KJ066_16245 [Acidobacteria bacterium]|nr:hypothetical protein [Acidobacteriota bacterium]